ncbi:sensor histidine kinase [Maridesulfovibrio zosterae]|uniref:sensor histidine kinase n=1 Tax=Maridesulfovibrio zosterae TaxID=82171 RepID=UPI00040D09C3|nr:ATP-binding protein [Maridesulfovibrio zosterae]
MDQKNQDQQDLQIKSFQLVKLLSWTLLIVIIGSSLGLSVFLAKHADETLLEKQKEFALLQAENLNHQIYRRFILPTIIGYGKIGLKNKEQMDRLDQVVRSTVHSFKVNEVRIYDPGLIISYSTDADTIGKDDLGGEFIKKVFKSGEPRYEFISKKSTLGLLFDLHMRPGTMLLQIVYPLRSEKSLNIDENVIMGVMVITQDITDDYQSVINFERLILFTSSFSALILFATIMAIIRRADIINAQRMKERQQFEKELNQSEKLASIGRMVSGVAHEIRNPLGIIRSSSELLIKRMNDSDQVNSKILIAIHEECKRLSRTVSDFLDYARPRKISLVAIDPADLIDKIFMFMESKCKESNIELERNYIHGYQICGDEDLLYRAFYNLIGNAVQAIEKDGSISVSLEETKGGINVVFSDTGPGFSPSVIDKVKDPFFTTKDSGTGLGLAIVTNIVESHNGKFIIGNNSDGGALIKVFLPAKKDC